MNSNRVLVDYTRAAPGFITSKRAFSMMEFIRSCDGAPEEALALLFRKSKLLLRKLRGAGMVYRVWVENTVLWLPVNTLPPLNPDLFFRKTAIGWLAARLKESGGRYEKGSAVFPNGAVFHVALVPPVPKGSCLAVIMRPGNSYLQKGSVWVFWEDLKTKNIKECLKSV
ncbi:MAG: hypothetical protein ACOY40_10195 [Bacillota bacterium]